MQTSMRKTTGRAAIPLAAGLLALACLAQAREFRAEGMDTGAGLGARHVAMGGTGTAFADDVYAAVYNPAGLAAVSSFELSVSRQLDARLDVVSFLGAAWRLPARATPGWDLTVATVYYPRIHARASGAFAETDFESIFLRYLLPGISGTFDGQIDSKTRAWRLAVGGAPRGQREWSVGGYVERVDCRSDFCGVHATSNGYTVSSTGAKATAFGLGVRWQPQPGWKLGASVNDVRTRLQVSTVTTDALGTRVRPWSASFPRKVSLEVARELGGGAQWAFGYERMNGQYGRSQLDLQVLRAGYERRTGAWTWRAGALAPLRIASTETGTLKPPAPVAPTLGVGWRSGALEAGAALYGHPVMSMHRDRPSPAVDLSLGWRF